MKNTKGFTIIEMLIVIMIVGILMLTLKKIFLPQNKNILYAENCNNNIYGKLNNYITNAIISKGIYTGGQNIFPEKYTIEFQPNSNIIILGYINNNINYNYNIINLSGNYAKKIYCQTNDYQMFLNGSKKYIEINRGLSNNTNGQIFKLENNGDNQFTGNINMNMCDLNGTNCKETANFIIDTRTKNIIYSKCTLYTGINKLKCIKRN